MIGNLELYYSVLDAVHTCPDFHGPRDVLVYSSIALRQWALSDD